MKVISSYGDIIYNEDLFVWIYDRERIACVGGSYKVFTYKASDVLKNELKKNKIFYPAPSSSINRDHLLFHCSMLYAYSSIIKHLLIKPFVEIDFLDGINEDESRFVKETMLKSIASSCNVLSKGKKVV